MVEPIKFHQGLNKIREMDPKIIFSSHLPPARDKTKQFLKLLDSLPTSQPFVPPNQAALEGTLAQMRGKKTAEN